MARNAGTVVENGVVQGLITEATSINFPEKAVSECWNVRFEKTGDITRRLGYGYEGDITSITGAVGTSGVCKSFLWKAVGNDGSRTFLVIQVGAIISFYEAADNGEFSGGILPFSINLETYKTNVVGVLVSDAEAGISAGNGRLFINHPYCEPIFVTYASATNTITVKSYQIKIRDMAGVDDGLAIGERPKTLTNLHKYNLYNQGWDQGIVPWRQDQGITPINAWLITLLAYPSNSDIWWTGKGINNNGQEALTERSLKLISKATGAAPKGHYVYNAFDMNRVSVSNISGIPGQTSEGYRPSVCAFYAGRIFFAGVFHPDFQSKVYYTQIIESDRNIGACYQANDPTSEQLSDLLATDGGEIKVTGMGKVAFMIEVGNNLFIFANNGIWAISGSGAEGTGFTATDFSVKKIANVGTEASASFVDVEGAPVWWNYDGIWTLTQEGVQSLTNDTIKTFIQDTIPGISRKYVQGAYNPLKQTVQWLWKSSNPSSVSDAYKYDRILEFNVLTKAFYPHKWSVSDQHFSTLFCATDITATSTDTALVTTSAGVTVTNNASDAVTASVSGNVAYTSSQFKYFAVGSPVSSGTCFLIEIDDTYSDFAARYP